MMQYVVKKLFNSPLEHIDVEYEQKNLFELTVGKLQKEQLRPGMEPRLLRFVLINNALRTLQCHMMKTEEPPITLTDGLDHHTENFLCNTFKDGGLSLSPQSPPTPIKVRSPGSPLSDPSPLVASTGVLEDPPECLPGDIGKLMENVVDQGGTCIQNGIDLLAERLGKHLNSDPDTPSPKRICHEVITDCLSGSTDSKQNGIVNGASNLNGLQNGFEIVSQPMDTADSVEESNTLVPIDFTEVDPSLYGYDLSAGEDASNTHILSPSSSVYPTSTLAESTCTPTVTLSEPSTSATISQATLCAIKTETPESSTNSSNSKNSKFSGSMEGIISTQNGHLENAPTTSLSPLSPSKQLCCSRDGSPENDFFEEIVSYLIT